MDENKNVETTATEEVETKVDTTQETKKEEKTFTQDDINKLLAKQKRDFQKQINELKMVGMSEEEKTNFLNSENLKQFNEEKAEFEKQKAEFVVRQNKLIAYEKCNQRGLNTEAVNLINFSEVKNEKDLDTALDSIEKLLKGLTEKTVNEKLKSSKTDYKQPAKSTNDSTNDIFELLNKNKIVK